MEKAADVETLVAVRTIRPQVKMRRSATTSQFSMVQNALESQVSPADLSASRPSSGSRLRHTISRTARSPLRLSRRAISRAHKTDLLPVVLMVELYAAWADRLRLRAASSSVDAASGCVIRGGRGERRY